MSLRNTDYDEEFFEFDALWGKLFSGKFDFKKFGFTATDSRLVPHIELFLPKLKEAICEIYIGPKSDVSKTDIQMFLIANGFLNSISNSAIEIHRSVSSYR